MTQIKVNYRKPISLLIIQGGGVKTTSFEINAKLLIFELPR